MTIDLRQAQTERLSRFFKECRAAGVALVDPHLAERLKGFFVSARALDKPVPSPTRQPDATLQQEALVALFEAVRAPLAAAKADGALLNAWTVAGLKRNEVRNAAVLAALLNPAISPQIGPAFFLNLLSRSRLPDARLPTAEQIAKGYTVRTEEYPMGEGRNRVDLCIEGPGFIVFIEVKIDAAEGLLQLGRYDEVLRAKATLVCKTPLLIYLSPRPPVTPPLGVVHLTWSDLVYAARKASQSGSHPVSKSLLLQFAAHAETFSG